MSSEDNDLKSFLSDLFEEFKFEGVINLLLDDKFFDEWKKAFTHKSFDASENYESLETLGDRSMELTFMKYLLEIFPDISEAKLTEIKIKYLSTQYQAEISRDLGLPDYIRIDDIFISPSIAEDLLEAFYGALLTVGDKIKNGLGYILCYNATVSIFEKVKISPEEEYLDVKTIVKEITEKLFTAKKLLEIEERYNKKTRRYRTIIAFTKETFEELNVIKPSITRIVLAKEEGQNKGQATKAAYESAKKKLYEYGITREYVEKTKKAKELGDIISYSPDVREKMRELNIKHLFFRSYGGRDKTIIQLIGILQNGKEKILGRGSARDVMEAKREAVLSFLKN